MIEEHVERAPTAASRTSYLTEVADELVPPPQTWELIRAPWRPRRGDGPTTHELMVVPNARRPRTLLPVTPRLAAAAVEHGPRGGGRGSRVLRRTLRALVRSGLGGWVLRDRLVIHGTSAATVSLMGLLRELAGADGAWAMPVTRARANRKPVIQVLSGQGVPSAFVKVGTNPLTRTLVQDEARALRRLATRLQGVRIPDVVACHDIDDLAVLVLSPLTAAGRAAEVPWDGVVAVARAIAAVDGVARHPLRSQPYWPELGRRLQGEDPRSRALAGTWNQLDHNADVVLSWGAWHGDFAPWNMASAGDEVAVWDFERFGTGVPVGFDLTHYAVQTSVLRPGVDPRTVLTERGGDAPSLLAAAHGLSASESRFVFAVYLLEVAARWIEDHQDRYGEQAAVLDAFVAASDAAARAAVASLTGSTEEEQ